MARYISHSPGYSVAISDPVEEPDPHRPHRNIIHKEGITAKFVRGDTTEYEREQAKKIFKFNGLPTEEDQMTPVDTLYRFSSYDTDMQDFDAKTKSFVEEKLDHALYNGTDFIRIDSPKRPSPWPGYDSLRSVKKILELTVETGSDAEGVLAYERENKNRPEVVEALQAVLNPTDPDEVVIEA